MVTGAIRKHAGATLHASLLPGLSAQVPAGRQASGAADLLAIEREMSARWRLSGPAAKYDPSCPPAPSLVVSGLPDLAYLRERVLADLYGRLATMRGIPASRELLVDCHELGVELAVASELGLASPSEVRDYGIASFTARCEESALRRLVQLTAIAERAGCYTDEAGIRLTMEPESVESVWSWIAQAFDSGLLVKDWRVGWYCPRCQTRLDEHELSRPGAFRPVHGLAVTARLRLDRAPPDAPPHVPPALAGADLLVSASPPWLLVACTGATVDPARTYVIAKRAGHDDRVVVAEDRFARVLGEGWHIAARFAGRDLAGATCHLPYGKPGAIRADLATASASETGIALLAPAYGAGELAAGEPQVSELPAGAAPGAVAPIGQDGCTRADLASIGDLFFADADQALADDLSDRGFLFATRPMSRRLPHCWCCGTVLLSRAMSGWHLRSQADSPAGGQDLTVSRERHWGVPLPIWECAREHATCIRSLGELAEASGCDLHGVDPHRPALDVIRIPCPKCGGSARRVSEVTDSRVDLMALTSGATPPLARPGGLPPSGGRGDLVEPWPLIERYGADALRWSLASIQPAVPSGSAPGRELDRITRQVLLRYWHCVRYYVRRASAAGEHQVPASPAVQPAARPALDRWLLSELHMIVTQVTAALDACRTDAAIRKLDGFLAHLSRWYIRLGRHRLIPGSNGTDRAAAIATLQECLCVLTRLLAPIVPFISDYAWGLVRGPGAPDSVHLAEWPQPDPGLTDQSLRRQLRLVRRIVRAGRAARAHAGIGCRQPLPVARIAPNLAASLPADLIEITARELNVKSIEPEEPTAAPEPGWSVGGSHGCRVSLDLHITPSLRGEGLARTATRAIQQARQRASLAPGDPITVHWHTPDKELADTLSAHAPQISRTVMATEFQHSPAPPPAMQAPYEHQSDKLPLTLWLSPHSAPPQLTSPEPATANPHHLSVIPVSEPDLAGILANIDDPVGLFGSSNGIGRPHQEAARPAPEAGPARAIFRDLRRKWVSGLRRADHGCISGPGRGRMSGSCPGALSAR